MNPHSKSNKSRIAKGTLLAFFFLFSITMVQQIQTGNPGAPKAPQIFYVLPSHADPSGIIHKVVYELTNFQSAPIFGGTQISLNVSWSGLPAGWVDSNLDNIMWFDQSGNPLNAWLESCENALYTPSYTGCSTSSASSSVVWVKLNSTGIPANAIIDVNLGFFASGTDNRNSNANGCSYCWGFSPQMTGTYGQYDNGAQVFNFYDDFSGSSLSSNWQVLTSHGHISYTVSNGLSITISPGGNYSDNLHVYTTSTYGPTVVDFYGKQGACLLDSFDAIPCTGFAYDTTVPSESGSFDGLTNGYDLSHFLVGINDLYKTISGARSSVSGLFADGNALYPHGFIWNQTGSLKFYYGGGTIGDSIGAGYSGLGSTSSDSSVSHTNSYFDFYTMGNYSSTQTSTYYWIRQRVDTSISPNQGPTILETITLSLNNPTSNGIQASMTLGESNPQTVGIAGNNPTVSVNTPGSNGVLDNISLGQSINPNSEGFPESMTLCVNITIGSTPGGTCIPPTPPTMTLFNPDGLSIQYLLNSVHISSSAASLKLDANSQFTVLGSNFNGIYTIAVNGSAIYQVPTRFGNGIQVFSSVTLALFNYTNAQPNPFLNMTGTNATIQVVNPTASTGMTYLSTMVAGNSYTPTITQSVIQVSTSGSQNVLMYFQRPGGCYGPSCGSGQGSQTTNTQSLTGSTRSSTGTVVGGVPFIDNVQINVPPNSAYTELVRLVIDNTGASLNSQLTAVSFGVVSNTLMKYNSSELPISVPSGKSGTMPVLFQTGGLNPGTYVIQGSASISQSTGSYIIGFKITIAVSENNRVAAGFDLIVSWVVAWWWIILISAILALIGIGLYMRENGY